MIDRRINTRHIQCFVEIVREGSFKAAAEKLNLTQPAISRTLKELEDVLGRTLMLRSRSGVSLTAEGETFLHFASMAVASLQQGIENVGPSGQAGRPSLAIGVLPSVAARLIPRVAAEFGEASPETVLRILDGPYAQLLNGLRVGELDLVIGRMGDHSQMRGIAFAGLYRERVSFIVRAGHPLLPSPTLSEMLNWPMIYPVQGSAIRPLVDRFFIENGVGEVPRRIETVSGAFGRTFVRHSDAVWAISESVVANEIEDGHLAKLPFNTDTTLGSVGVLMREEWEPTPPARMFRKALRACVDASEDLTH